MMFVLDENIPNKISQVLNVLDPSWGQHEIKSINDLGLNGCKDVDLFPKLKDIAKQKKKKCIFITGDSLIFQRKPEIQSFKNNDMIAFVCPPSFCNKPFWERTVYMMNCWQAISNKAERAKKKEVFGLPAYKGLFPDSCVKCKN